MLCQNSIEKAYFDFSDYEHFALQILTNEDGSPSEIAESYRQHFQEILVDEYQDTNRVQEKILSCIKRVMNIMVIYLWLEMLSNPFINLDKLIQVYLLKSINALL